MRWRMHPGGFHRRFRRVGAGTSWHSLAGESGSVDGMRRRVYSVDDSERCALHHMWGTSVAQNVAAEQDARRWRWGLSCMQRAGALEACEECARRWSTHRNDISQNIPTDVAKSASGKAFRRRNEIHHVVRYACPTNIHSRYHGQGHEVIVRPDNIVFSHELGDKRSDLWMQNAKDEPDCVKAVLHTYLWAFWICQVGFTPSHAAVVQT